MKKLNSILGAVVFLAGITSAQSQTKAALFNKLVTEDTGAVVTLAIYPKETREAMLVAGNHPETLLQVEELQKKTKIDFREVMNNFSREEQEKTFELVRYPGLIEGMANQRNKPYAEIEQFALRYPKEVQPVIIDFCQNKIALIESVYRLELRNQRLFDELKKSMDMNMITNIDKLLDHPDALAFLGNNTSMALLAGKIYEADPVFMNGKLDSIATVYANQQAKELEDWKNGLDKNPEAKKEMEMAAREFANEQGYDDAAVTNTTVVVNYVYYPYPYWYGYPWWYDYPYWYPYPWWYHCGFYWGPAQVVYVGCPSPYFTWWYFYHNNHHYYYPHYSDYYLHHHEGHRETFSASHRQVSRWEKENEKQLPPGYLNANAKRPERLKELGRFEIDFDKNRKEDPELSRQNYLDKNPHAYPNMKPGNNPVLPNTNKPKQPGTVTPGNKNPGNVPKKPTTNPTKPSNQPGKPTTPPNKPRVPNKPIPRTTTPNKPKVVPNKPKGTR